VGFPFEPPRPLRLAIVNDYEVVVRGLQSMLRPYADRVEVVELATSTSVVEPVDVALYDTFTATQVSASDVDKLLVNEYVQAVATYTWNMHPDLIAAAQRKGVVGYLGKSLAAEDLVDALERIAGGETVIEPAVEGVEVVGDDVIVGEDWPGKAEGLSIRQAEVVALITQGLGNEEIAERTYLTVNTVKSYIRVAYRRMGVTTRAQAVIWGYEHGMVPDRVHVVSD
jgi:DNA-binding NarL/FixJ family response regulator